MTTISRIEWTEQTWNPTVGCTKISPGCKNCYAEAMSRRYDAMLFQTGWGMFSAWIGFAACAVIDSQLGIASLAHSSNGSGPALLLQSSGTTGLPKIVRRDARSLDAVAANMVEAIDFTAADRVLACVPLSHSYGLEHGLLAPIFAGATVHLAQGFDLASVRRELVESAITAFPAVPSWPGPDGGIRRDSQRKQ